MSELNLGQSIKFFDQLNSDIILMATLHSVTINLSNLKWSNNLSVIIGKPDFNAGISTGSRLVGGIDDTFELGLK